jgi:uncharacterized protein involved in propanediol utilization
MRLNMTDLNAIHTLVHRHCGELIQGPMSVDGRQVVGLITLPMDCYYTSAAFSPRANGEGVAVFPESKTKARHAVSLFCDTFSLDLKGKIMISENLDLGEGRGFGSSTAEVLAALSVTSVAGGLNLSPEVLQAFGWAAEKANDPLLLDSVLYASREGRVLEVLPSIPSFFCLGFDLGRAVDTTDLVERQNREGFSQDHLAAFELIVAMVRHGIAKGDLRLIAEAATRSAMLNQEQVPLGEFSTLRRIVAEFALGLAISHSGTACALLFSPMVKQRTVDHVKEVLGRELAIARFFEFTANWDRHHDR